MEPRLTVPGMWNPVAESAQVLKRDVGLVIVSLLELPGLNCCGRGAIAGQSNGKS